MGFLWIVREDLDPSESIGADLVLMTEGGAAKVGDFYNPARPLGLAE
ncbi:hypothetical protein ABZ826_07315 [Streptomyces sp. NPDC047515]